MGGCRILIVDDLAGIRMMLEHLFREEGYTVFTAGNGRDALDVLDLADVDVILTDLEMPVMDGWQLAQVVRDRTVELPLVAMTARGITSSPIRGDFVAYLDKPFDFKALLATVDDAVASAARARRNEASPSNSRVPLTSLAFSFPGTAR
jgi:CheY-like chemotaxis protein